MSLTFRESFEYTTLIKADSFYRKQVESFFRKFVHQYQSKSCRSDKHNFATSMWVASLLSKQLRDLTMKDHLSEWTYIYIWWSPDRHANGITLNLIRTDFSVRSGRGLEWSVSELTGTVLYRCQLWARTEWFVGTTCDTTDIQRPQATRTTFCTFLLPITRIKYSFLYYLLSYLRFMFHCFL